jgi:hypothetical protein
MANFNPNSLKIFNGKFDQGKHNKLVDQIARQKLRSGPNYSISDGSGGTIIITAPASIAASTNTPFQIFATKNIVDGEWDNTYNVTLYPGLINQLLPTNIFNVINQGIGSTQYVVLTCMNDGYAITSATWSLMSSVPTPPDATPDGPPATLNIIIGVIFYNSTPNTITVYQIIFDNITATPTEWTRTTRAGAGPFELAYVIYYYWAIS